jgi:threonine/homoserine/homoserine lactone efflux protein
MFLRNGITSGRYDGFVNGLALGVSFMLILSATMNSSILIHQKESTKYIDSTNVTECAVMLIDNAAYHTSFAIYQHRQEFNALMSCIIATLTGGIYLCYGFVRFLMQEMTEDYHKHD